MRGLRLAAVFVSAAQVLTSGSPPAFSAPAPAKNCEVVDLTLVCDDDYQEPDSDGVVPAGAGGTDEDAPTAVWTREIVQEAPFVAYCETPDDEVGTLVRDTLRDAETGEVLSQEFNCISSPDDPEPAEPPTPPSREEVLDAVDIPVPEISADPASRGLTGLESRFWIDGGGEVTASTTLRGWTVSGSLQAANWVWKTGDGARYQTDQPAARHTYERLPESPDNEETTWQVEVEVTWEGAWSVSGYGTEFVIDELGTVTVGSLDYEVIEVRGVLDEEDG